MQLFFGVFALSSGVADSLFCLFRVSAQTQDNVEWTAVSVCQHERLF
jgi:hypothetical protein